MPSLNFKPRKKREVYHRDDWELAPGDFREVESMHVCNALESFGRRRGWVMRREKRGPSKWAVGREA